MARFHRFVVGLIRFLPAGRVRTFILWNRVVASFRPELIAETRWGAKIICDARDFISQMILSFGVWEPYVSETIRRVLKPGDVFVDVGANIGYHSLLAAGAVGSRGKVIAIEASPTTFGVLSRNIALNSFVAIDAFNLAVSDREGFLDFFRAPSDNTGRSGTIQSDGFVLEAKVQAKQLHAIIPQEWLSRVTLIKIDIEGGEVDVVRDIIENIDHYPRGVSLLVEVSRNSDWREQFERMLALGFRAQTVPNDYSIRSYLDQTSNVRTGQLIKALPDEQVDVLFTRQDEQS